MTTKLTLQSLCLISLVFATASTQADPCSGLLTDKANHPMTTLAKPALLQAVVDPQFGTTIRRISNAGTGHVVKPMYSTIPAWNADESYIILYHTEGAPYAGMHVDVADRVVAEAILVSLHRCGFEHLWRTPLWRAIARSFGRGHAGGTVL